MDRKFELCLHLNAQNIHNNRKRTQIKALSYTNIHTHTLVLFNSCTPGPDGRARPPERDATTQTTPRWERERKVILTLRGGDVIRDLAAAFPERVRVREPDPEMSKCA